MALAQAHKSGLLARLERIEAAGQEEIRNYGFDPAKGWREYFEFVETEDGSFFKPLTAYANYVSPSGFNNEFIAKLGATNAAEELSLLGRTDETAKSKAREVGFAFLIEDEAVEAGVSIVPICGKPNSKGVPMSTAIKMLEYASGNVELDFGPHDLSILQVIKTSPLGRSYYNHKMTTVAALSSVASKLEHHPYVFLSNGFLMGTIARKNLSPLRFIAGLPGLRIRISEDEAGFEVNVFIAPKDEEYQPLESLSTNTVHRHFILIGDALYFVESSRLWHTALAAIQSHKMRFAQNKLEEAFETFFKKLENAVEIQFEDMKTIQVKPEQELQALSREVYLSEVGNFVIFEPYVRYGEELVLPANHQPQLWELEDAGLQSHRLDPKAGRTLMETLKSVHPTFAEQRRSDFYHLSYKELLEQDVAIALFEKLREADIKIFGEKDLSRLKAIPKHAKVSYTVRSEIDWFEVNANFDYGDEMLSLAALKKRFVPGRNFVELNDGGKGIIPEKWLKRLERIFKSGETAGDALRVSSMHFNLIDELFSDLEEPELQAFIAERRNKLLHFKGIESHPLPRGIKAKLRPYQNDGFQWMCFLHEFGWGGILADDMGLGKTLQVITFLKHILRSNKQVNLVVVPTSLLFNWENELQKFAPAIKAHFHHGPGRCTDAKVLSASQLVVTSYGTMLSDIELLRHIDFNYVVLDESQAIKNTASKRYKAARLLKANNRLAMTGTPIENNTFDLYAQLSFLNPGFLGSAKQFKTDFAKAIDSRRDSEKAAQLQSMINPFVLRRTKEEVATELPDKVEDVLYCELGAAQRKVYDAHRNEIRETILGNMDSEVISSMRFAVLQGLTRLRQICDSPLLLPGKDKYTGSSEKIDLLLRHIREKTSNHKLLIFSQFVQMLKLIEERIDHEGIPYAYLDGKSSTKERQAAVEKFQGDPDCRVFLISLKAGGTGLNLMAADYVYIVDPWWNPAVENQAIDRCYRIGQDKKVIAYRMICKDTVEEKIQELQARKTSIANDLITTDEGVMQKLDKDDLMALFF
ncbi:MAG: DEAD/DEAH box helicase [Cryomorphaceae bacterium]